LKKISFGVSQWNFWWNQWIFGAPTVFPIFLQFWENFCIILGVFALFEDFFVHFWGKNRGSIFVFLEGEKVGVIFGGIFVFLGRF
jgi:hypothetical protein